MQTRLKTIGIFQDPDEASISLSQEVIDHMNLSEEEIPSFIERIFESLPELRESVDRSTVHLRGCDNCDIGCSDIHLEVVPHHEELMRNRNAC